MPRTAYLIPGRGGMWGGWRRDVRFRRFRRRFRGIRSPWVGRRGGARDPPATHLETPVCKHMFTYTCTSVCISLFTQTRSMYKHLSSICFVSSFKQSQFFVSSFRQNQ